MMLIFAISVLQPDLVVHLAAQSHVPTSFEKPGLTWDINVMGTLHLFESIKTHAPDAGILFVSSSEIYGKSFLGGTPLKEDASFKPQNPYAASKAAADIMAGQYAEQGLRIIRMRPFNHIGVGQRSEFVVPAFASQIAKIESGQQEPVLLVGNLDAQRDFLNVVDVVSAYVLALENMDSLPPGLALNVCSGVPRRISDVLNCLLGLSQIDIQVRLDPLRMRPSDIPVAVGDCSALVNRINWSPKVTFKQTLQNILNEWRQKVVL